MLARSGSIRAVLALLCGFAGVAFTVLGFQALSSAADTSDKAPKPPDRLEYRGDYRVDLTGKNQAMTLRVTNMRVGANYGQTEAPDGANMLIVAVELTNTSAQACQIADLRDRFAVIVNKQQACFLDAGALSAHTGRMAEGHLPGKLTVEPGATVKGDLVFDVPDDYLRPVELRFYDTAGEQIRLTLAGTQAAPAPDDKIKPVANAQCEIYANNWGRRNWLERPTYAPVLMRDELCFATLDLRGRSLAKDADGKPVMLSVPDWRKHIYLVADGQYACPLIDSPGLPDALRWLPDLPTSCGPLWFQIPREYDTLDLRLDFPDLDKGGKSADLTYSLYRSSSVPKKPPGPKAIGSVNSKELRLDFLPPTVVPLVAGKQAPQGCKNLVVPVSVVNGGASGQWFAPAPIGLIADGVALKMDSRSSLLTHPPLEDVFCPPGQTRTFELLFVIPAGLTAAKAQFGSEPPVDLGAIPAAPPLPESLTKDPKALKKSEADITATSAPASMPYVKIDGEVVLDPSLTPKGLAGVGLTQEQVDKAVLRGRAFVWAAMQSAAKSGHFVQDDHTLGCLALLHAGALNDLPEFAKAFAGTLQDPKQFLEGTRATYISGILAQMAEGSPTGRTAGDDANRQTLALAVQCLLETQGRYGTWYYCASDRPKLAKVLADIGAPTAKTGGGASTFIVEGGRPLRDLAASKNLKRRTDRIVGNDGDNSNTQFAVLGLWSGERAGLALDQDVWRRILLYTQRRQCADGSCGYGEDRSGYASMTCSYICTCAIAMHYLGQDPLFDRGIHRALGWLAQNWTFETNTGKGSHKHYYIYSVERVGRVLGVDFIGTHEWYPEGARHLLDTQKPDGGWCDDPKAKSSNFEDTCFALLFLTKATASLAPEPRGGQGQLIAEGPSVVANRLYLILDASGSMNAEMTGRTKFDVAKDAIQAIVKDLSAKTQAALRVYGNKMREAPGGVDEDSTLEIPMGELNRDAFLKKLNSTYPRGKTPLAFSLDKTAEDLQQLKVSVRDPVVVVLLTDGMEDTAKNRDPADAARKFAAAVPGAIFNLIAFDLSKEQEIKAMQEIAQAGNGRCWMAPKAEELAQQLRTTVFESPGIFEILDKDGKKIADGRFGTSITLKEGKYTFKTVVDGKEVTEEFWINTGKITRIKYAAPKSSANKPAPDKPAPKAAPKTAPPAAKTPPK